MKQYIILIGALAIVIILDCIQINFLNSTGEKISKVLESLNSSVEKGDYTHTEALADELEDLWNSVRARWDIFTEHNDVEEFESHLVSLRVYIKERENTDILVEISVLKQRIEHIIQSETLSLATVF